MYSSIASHEFFIIIVIIKHSMVSRLKAWSVVSYLQWQNRTRNEIIFNSKKNAWFDLFFLASNKTSSKAICCDSQDVLLHITTDATPLLLTFASFAPPSSRFTENFTLLLAEDIDGDGFQRPLFAAAGAKWSRGGGASTMSYGPVYFPALLSSSSSSPATSTQSIGVYLQSRSREAAASLTPVEER